MTCFFFPSVGVHDLEHFFSKPTTWLQQVSFLYRAAVHTAAGLFSSVFWGTRRAARAIQCATPGSPPFNPPSPHPAPPPGTCTSSCAAAEPPCFVGVLCVLGVAPVRYFYIFFEFLAVELLRAPLPSRPIFFALCARCGPCQVLLYYIFFFELPCFELLRPWCARALPPSYRP